MPGSDLPENPIFLALEPVLGTLLGYLSRKQGVELLQVALLVLWEISDHWPTLVNGNELEIYQTLLAVRAVADATVLEATNAVRETLGSSTDAVYGLATLHACLLGALKKISTPSAAVGTYVFGLNGMNRYILRLPAQVLEEELPRIRPLLLKSLGHENTVVRSAASMVIVSAQIVLHDQAHLFTLLDGLSEEKKNFLTYLFDKNKIQSTNGDMDPAFHKMELEVNRLDGRVNPR